MICPGQQDIHEFLIQFLSWLGPTCMDNSWQRRVQEGEQIRTVDHGATFNPPTLSAPAGTNDISLQALIDFLFLWLGALFCI